MIIEKVTVFDVEQNVEKKKKDGGTYKVTVLQVKGSSGKAEHNILQSIVDKSSDMKDALASLQMGDIATVVLEKKEGSKFANVVGVHVGDVPDATSQLISYSAGGGFQRKQGSTWTPKEQDTTGIQVGNALNNAALLLAHKIEKGTLEEVAEKVLRTAENLKAKLKAGMYTNVVEPTKTTVAKSATNTFVEDEDIPFE